jgi:hypothetical protein
MGWFLVFTIVELNVSVEFHFRDREKVIAVERRKTDPWI